jgi:hypothetical protein
MSMSATRAGSRDSRALPGAVDDGPAEEVQEAHPAAEPPAADPDAVVRSLRRSGLGGEDDVEAGTGPRLAVEIAPVGGGGGGVTVLEALDEGVPDAEDGVACP